MKLDLTDESWNAALAPAGIHLADLTDLRVITSSGGDRELCELTFMLETGHRVSELITIWVDESQHDPIANLGRAKVLLEQLARATGIPLPADSEQLPATYVGQRIEIVIAHAVRRGVRAAVIKKLGAVQG